MKRVVCIAGAAMVASGLGVGLGEWIFWRFLKRDGWL